MLICVRGFWFTCTHTYSTHVRILHSCELLLSLIPCRRLYVCCCRLMSGALEHVQLLCCELMSRPGALEKKIQVLPLLQSVASVWPLALTRSHVSHMMYCTILFGHTRSLDVPLQCVSTWYVHTYVWMWVYSVCLLDMYIRMCGCGSTVCVYLICTYVCVDVGLQCVYGHTVNSR